MDLAFNGFPLALRGLAVGPAARALRPNTQAAVIRLSCRKLGTDIGVGRAAQVERCEPHVEPHVRYGHIWEER